MSTPSKMLNASTDAALKKKWPTTFNYREKLKKTQPVHQGKCHIFQNLSQNLVKQPTTKEDDNNTQNAYQSPKNFTFEKKNPMSHRRFASDSHQKFNTDAGQMAIGEDETPNLLQDTIGPFTNTN